MKSYDYLVFCEHEYRDNSGYPADTELVEACTTLEKAISVISTLSGIRYNASRIVQDIKDCGIAYGAYIRIWEPEEYRMNKWFMETRRYFVQKVERH